MSERANAMSDMSPAVTGSETHDNAVARFLAQFSTTCRAEALHLALQALRARVEPDRVLACELAWEVHVRGYWSQVRRANGAPYETEEAYFREVLGLTSWRTAYKRLAIGRMLWSFGESERSAIRAAITAVGLAKAGIVTPAIEHFGEWRAWLDTASQLSAVLLQAQVSAALEALPRGREPSPPGEHFRRAVLSAMPDIEAMELVEHFFAVGRHVVETTNAIAIFLAGCRECLADWEVALARRMLRRVPDENYDRPTTSDTDTDHVSALPEVVCPRGQNV